MRNFATVAAFAAGANALVSRGGNCCFHLKATGGASGTIGQLDDGQNRVYGGLSEAQFCIDSNGAIVDSNGRGCVVTGETTQFQCDAGASPMPGFSINSQGQLSYKGDSSFVACQTGLNGGMNLYTTESDKVTQCKDISLMADSCSGSGSGSGSSSVPVPSSTPVAGQSTPVPAPSSSASVPSVPGGSSVPAPPEQTTVHTTMTTTYCPETASTVPVVSVPSSSVPAVPSGPAPSQPAGSQTPSTPQPSSPPSPPEGSSTPVYTPTPQVPTSQPSETATSTQPSSTQSSSGSCPTDLSGNYEYPHLIVPIDSSKPDYAPGTSYNGTITSTVSSIFNFDIPSSDAGKTCSLVFLFPHKEDLETSSYSFSGDGKIDFASLESTASQSTTYNNAPAVKEDYGETTVSPGNSYVISTFSCPAGQAVSYEMKNAGSTNLNFFEDYNPSPLGLYITVC
ncbi:ubiquitin 3 binding protein But2 C-terminal domain-containing protein [Aspergillus ambiguus]|uniref:putative GPI anchored cell wall protein n=1 Tax=Aspergillus ambiguus TaxID=176160 RepID=UPI003CCCC58C